MGVVDPIDKEKCRQVWMNISMSYNTNSEPSQEQLDFFFNECKKDKIKEAMRVTIHECGHYIHQNYFNNKAFRIPGNNQKNSKENFAVAFTEYVQNGIIPESSRFQKMDKIIKSLSLKK